MFDKLDLSRIQFSDTIVSYEDALKDVPSFDVLSDKKIVVTKAEKDYGNKCVKLEISY